MTSARIPANDVFDLRKYIVPRQRPWVFKVDGLVFDHLSDAVAHVPSPGALIYCRPRMKVATP
jgi:hypothetical protein